MGAAETRVVEVELVVFLGCVLVGVEPVVVEAVGDARVVVVVVVSFFDVFPPLAAGTVVVVVVVVAPGVVAPITSCACAIAACIWYGPVRRAAKASSSHRRPSDIWAWSQRERS